MYGREQWDGRGRVKVRPGKGVMALPANLEDPRLGIYRYYGTQAPVSHVRPERRATSSSSSSRGASQMTCSVCQERRARIRLIQLVVR